MIQFHDSMMRLNETAGHPIMMRTHGMLAPFALLTIIWLNVIVMVSGQALASPEEDVFSPPCEKANTCNRCWLHELHD